jgi:molybdopterin converting factor small subunit
MKPDSGCEETGEAGAKGKERDFVAVKATGGLKAYVPSAGGVSVAGQATVGDVIKRLGIDSDLVMLFVVDGDLADMDSPLPAGSILELIPPISGG